MQNGDIYRTNYYGNLKVIGYTNCSNVFVEFIDTGYRTTTYTANIRKGAVKDLMRPMIHGVGYIGDGCYTARSRAYNVWAHMITRCYSHKSLERRPTYKGCSVAAEWHNYQNFAGWYQHNYTYGYELDKDLLVIGNKVYSPDTCVFVPSKLNSFLLCSTATKGEYPTGVSYYKQNNKYVSKCGDGEGGEKCLGYFNSPNEASIAWGNYKLLLALSMKPIMDGVDVRIYPNIVSVINSRLLAT